MKNKIICMLIMSLVISVVCLPFGVSASDTITSCVDLTNASKNESGSGYYWANRYDTMTLTNLHIETSDEFGLRLPADSTVVLEGNNYIKASRAAIVCAGTTTFTGSGSLTLIGGENGIYVNCSSTRKTIKIVSGSYTIEAGEYGILSESVPFSIADCTMNIKAGKYAARAYTLSVNNAIIVSEGALNAINDLTVSDADTEILSSTGAFLSDKGDVNLSKMSYEVGVDLSSLASANEYGGEKAVKTVGTVQHYQRSILFGGDVHVFVDYLVIGGTVVILGAVVFFKVYRQKKKDERKKAEIEKIKAENGGKLY